MTDYFVITPNGTIRELVEAPVQDYTDKFGERSLLVYWDTKALNIEGRGDTHTLSPTQVKAMQLICRRYIDRMNYKKKGDEE